MAIQKQVEIMGFTTTNYAKIHSVTINEEIQTPKLYTVTVGVNFYTNETKEHLYESTNFSLQGLTESELSLDQLYVKLITISDFEGYTNT